MPVMTNHIRGLDAIRFICAMWVVLSHVATPPLKHFVDETSPVGFVLHGLFGNLWPGTAAVIVFFVISGFCIHLPYARTLRIDNTPAYLTRRYVRIGIPVAVAIWLASYLGVTLALFDRSILWSLFCELIYYGIYPLLLQGRRASKSWWPMWWLSMIAAFAVIMTDPWTGRYSGYGLQLNWLLGLPCWLLGCILAEAVSARLETRTLAAVKPRAIWALRLAVWGVAVLCSVLRFHTPFGYNWTLNFFAILASFWLYVEISYYTSRLPWAFLENAGKWSYSLYLTHQLSRQLLIIFGLPDFGPVFTWGLKISFVLLMAYLFYLTVEWPAHYLARHLATTYRRVRTG